MHLGETSLIFHFNFQRSSGRKTKTNFIWLSQSNRWNVKYYLWIISRSKKIKKMKKWLLIDHAMSQVTSKLLQPEGLASRTVKFVMTTYPTECIEKKPIFYRTQKLSHSFFIRWALSFKYSEWGILQHSVMQKLRYHGFHFFCTRSNFFEWIKRILSLLQLW